MHWLFFALSSVLFFTTLNLLQKIVSSETRNPRALSVVFNFYAAIFSLAIFFLTGAYRDLTLPGNLIPWLCVIVACFFYAMFERLRFRVAQSLQASVYSTISTWSVIVAFFGSTLLYKEQMTIEKVFGFLLITASLILVSYKPGEKVVQKGLSLALTAFTMLGLGWALDKMGANSFNPSTYNILVWVIPVFLVYFPYIRFSDLMFEVKKSSWKVVLLAFVNVVGYFLQLKALEISDATRVIPIVQTSIIVTVIFGIILLGERDDVTKKILASIIAVVGVVTLS